jgi:dTDP-4-dehydrorhamnose 3,5-epimerase
MTEVKPTSLEGVVEVVPAKFGDDRGFFSETYNFNFLSMSGININFVQDNHSLSRHKGVLRGLHYQLPPFAQDKLVRVLRGSVLDVAIDIRLNSPSYGSWVAVVLSAEKGNQLLIPKGFAHGFLTLEDNTEFFYKVSDYYSAEHDRSISYADPEIGIDWGIDPSNLILSEKDKNAPFLADADNTFIYGESF